MSTTLLIVPAEVSDKPALINLINNAYRGDGSRVGWTTEADFLEGIRVDEAAIEAIFANPAATLLKAADAAGSLLGCVLLEQQQDAMYLGMLTVTPGLQNAGIGGQLLAAGEQMAKAKGLPQMVMTVITLRTALIAWYERKGYRRTGETKPFPDDPRFGIPKQPLEFEVLRKQLS